MKRITIAIDGHSSCGKSTMAKQLAQRIAYVYVDTGAMYRAVALYVLRNGLLTPEGEVDTTALAAAMSEIHVSFRLNGETQLPETYLNDELVEREIRTLEVSQLVSPVAALGFVRQQMVAQQQALGAGGGVVMDGRDVGTAVFPNAELKIFVTASAEVRAQRRFDELQAKGMPANYDEILANVLERDYIDTHREIDPLRQAPDALLLDNSALTREAQFEWLVAQYERVVSEA